MVIQQLNITQRMEISARVSKHLNAQISARVSKHLNAQISARVSKHLNAQILLLSTF
jgi:ribosomal protein L31E